MKLLTTLSLIAGIATITPLVQAQVQVTTPPVGVAKMVIAGGRTLVAPVFVNDRAYQNPSVSISQNVGAGTSTVTFNNPGFTVNEFAEGAYPKFYAEVASRADNISAAEGFAFDIISNTASAIVVNGLLLTDFSLAQDESFIIREHITVASFFEGASVARRDTLQFFTINGRVDVQYDGSAWDLGEFPIYPGTGFIANLRGDVTVSTAGTVKTTKTIIPVYNDIGVINLVSSASPVDVAFDSVDGSQLARRDVVRFLEPGTLAVIAEFQIDSNGNFVPAPGTTWTDIPAGEPFILYSRNSLNLSLPAAYSESDQ